MAFNDTYRESIQTKHVANVGFTSTAKAASNEAAGLKNPHQLIASQIPAVDVVGTYGPLVADGVSAGLVEKHTVKLTVDPSVNGNKAWYATEDNCTETGHAARGVVRLEQIMRFPGSQYYLRLFTDNSNSPGDEIYLTETAFNWEYDPSAGIVYFDGDPLAAKSTSGLWAEFYTYVGDTVADGLGATTSGLENHTHTEIDITDLDKYTQAEVDGMFDTVNTTISGNYTTLDDKIDTTSGTLQQAIDDLGEARDEFIELTDTIPSYNEGRILFESADAVIDDAAFTYVSGTQTLNAPNMGVDTDLTVGGNADVTGNIDLDGTLAFDTGTSINEFVTTVDGSSTDDQVPTAKSVYDDVYTPLDTKIDTVSGTLQTEITNNYNTLDTKIDTTSGTLQTAIDDLDSELTEDIIWEVVDTPFEQIRPKLDHQGKAIYTAGNLTIGGDLTVSGTTTTVHSEELTVADKTITVNAGEAGAGITGDQYAGIEVDRGSETNYMFVFDEVQDNFRVGISGSLQAVATREDSPIDTRVPWWNDSETRFDTAGNTYMSVVTTSGSGQIYLVADTTGVFTADSTGITLESGTNVNEIVTTAITSSNTDDQLATAKAIYTTMSGMGTIDGTPDHMLFIDNSGNLATTANMTYDADGTINVLSLTDDEQRIGDADGSYVAVSASGVEVGQNSVEVIYLSETSQIIGNTEDTSMSMDQDADSITFTAAGTSEAFVTTSGLALKLGTSVNEVSTTVDAASTDDQVSTSKSIYDYVEDRVTTATGTLTQDHNEMENLQGGTADEYYHLTSNEYTAFSSDGSTWTFSQDLALATGGSVNEIVTTVTSGTTDSQLPTAKAVWDLTEAAAAAVHIHYDVDAVHVSDTSWTYGTGFAAVPDGLHIYVNGVKQRIGSDYDCTVDVPGGVITISFNYSVRTADWVNVTYYA